MTTEYSDYEPPPGDLASSSFSLSFDTEKGLKLGRILIALGRALSGVATPQEAARLILSAADELLGWDACAVDLVDGDEGYSLLSIDTIDGARKECSRVYGRIREESMMRKVLDHGPCIICRTEEELGGSSHLRTFGNESHPSASLLFVPIRKGTEHLGMMTIQSYSFDAYSEDDLRLLQVLADYCSGCLARAYAEVRFHEAEQRQRETLAELRERERTMNRDLELAREVQERFLPDKLSEAKGIKAAALYRACSNVGGDLYGTYNFAPKFHAYYIADVSGHGVSAALVMANLKANIDRALRALDGTFGFGDVPRQEIVDQTLASLGEGLNRSTCNLTGPCDFITFLFCLLQADTGDLYFLNAGHNKPIIRQATSNAPGENRSAEEIQVPSNIPLGLDPDFNFEIFRSRIEWGDLLLLYTDGVSERQNEVQDEYGIPRLLKLIGRLPSSDPEESLATITQENDAFSGTDPQDDQAILAIQRI